MSKFVVDKIANKLFPGITKFMKENVYWHQKKQPYDKTMHPMYGLKQTDHMKKTMSAIMKKRTGKKNPFYGKKHSEETRRNWSILRSDPKNNL